MDSDIIHHLVDKLDYLDIVSNSRSINFSSVIAVFVFYQKGYYIVDIIDTPVWILLFPSYKYPTKLLYRFIVIITHQADFSQKTSQSCSMPLPSYRAV